MALKSRTHRDNGYYVYRVFALAIIMVYQTLLTGALPYLNLPQTAKEASEPPGSLNFGITWPDGDEDVDMWVYGPEEDKPTGYSNKHGMSCDLQSDDRGHAPDGDLRNFENLFCRGIYEGEYIINVHCWSCSEVPKEVRLRVTRSDPKTRETTVLTTVVAHIQKNGDEITLVRFKMDALGNLVPNSMNNVFRPLRTNWDDQQPRDQSVGPRF